MPLAAIGEECGTSATSPRRRAPSSVSISFLQHFLAAACVRLDDASLFKAHLNAFDHGALMRERLGGRHRAIRAILVGRGEDFFRGHVGNAVEAVSRGRAAAQPEMIVGKAEAKIGSGPAILQGRSAFRSGAARALCRPASCAFQAATGSSPLMRVVSKIASQSLARADVGRIVGKDGRCPRRSGAGHDGPVDGVARNQFERGTVGLRDGAIGAADFSGIFIGKQRGIAAGDGQARAPLLKAAPIPS
jgi:hypothetical protein